MASPAGLSIDTPHSPLPTADLQADDEQWEEADDGSVPPNTVFLNIYDIFFFNAVLYPAGLGIHHTGVEVYGSEYGFGRAPSGTGIFEIQPKTFPQHIFRESLVVGRTSLSPAEVTRLFRAQASSWQGPDYELTQRNCNHFAEHFAKLLISSSPSPAAGTVDPMASKKLECYEGTAMGEPAVVPWINRASRLALWVPFGFAKWLNGVDKRMQGM